MWHVCSASPNNFLLFGRASGASGANDVQRTVVEEKLRQGTHCSMHLIQSSRRQESGSKVLKPMAPHFCEIHYFWQYPTERVLVRNKIDLVHLGGPFSG